MGQGTGEAPGKGDTARLQGMREVGVKFHITIVMITECLPRSPKSYSTHNWHLITYVIDDESIRLCPVGMG